MKLRGHSEGREGHSEGREGALREQGHVCWLKVGQKAEKLTCLGERCAPALGGHPACIQARKVGCLWALYAGRFNGEGSGLTGWPPSPGMGRAVVQGPGGCLGVPWGHGKGWW